MICGDSYSSQSSLALSFGLSNNDVIDKIIVKWPSGIIQTFENIENNQTVLVIEGKENFQVL